MQEPQVKPKQAGSFGKVMVGIYLFALFVYLAFRAVTPFWVDMSVGATGVVVALFEMIEKRKRSAEAETSTPAADK